VWPDLSLLACRVHGREHWRYEHEALFLFGIKDKVPVKKKKKKKKEKVRRMRRRERRIKR
jgi:hypothetical protein